MFILNNKEATPLYQQLYLQIRDRIVSGELPAHYKLPSIRDMATGLATSRNTVEGAFQELCAEGYIYSQSRSGYFVSYIDQVLASSSQADHPQQDLHPKLAERYRFDFHPARLDPEIFPASLWRKCLTDCLRTNAGDFSQYSEPQGEWGLRCNLQFYLARSRGVHCTPDQIVICSGLQHSLEIVAQLIRGRHQSVAIENPGYHLPRDVFHNNGFNIIPVDVGTGGLNMETLRSTFSTVAYITPSHQMPLGYVMPVANRLELISWSKTGERLIIEDDYDSELRYIGRPISSLQGLCSDGNIIYQGTFSKVLSPALRLSYMVLPHSLLNDYNQLFQNHFCQVPLIIQKAMINFIERGHWEQHIRRSRNFYKKKHEIMLQAIDQNFGRKAKVIGQGAGLHIVLELTESLTDELGFVERAKQKGIRLLPFSEFYVSGEPEANKLFLGFGGMRINEIQKGVETLANLIH
jgi:GntR family transcriptional regulator/MocR family aminotransferase